MNDYNWIWTDNHLGNKGAKILNRMFGYDITKVEISNEDTERDEMEKLTADELRSILANVNKENTECQ